jgi:hypothetical protein
VRKVYTSGGEDVVALDHADRTVHITDGRIDA